MYIEGDIPTMVSGGNNGGNGGFGYGTDAWVLIILFALIFGWGRNGNGNGNGGTTVYETGAEVQRGFDTQSILNKLNGIENGLCDGFYAMNTGLLNGFSGLNNAITTNGYESRLAVNDLGYRLQDCCCKTQNLIQSTGCELGRSIDGVNYNMAKNTCDIIRAGQDNTQRILDFLTTDKIATLQSENQTLKFQASQSAQNAFITANQEAQTAELIRRLGRDCPVPAFVVPNPNCCYDYSVTRNTGCGCGL